MKLAELDPHFFSDGEERHGMGISFECPHCRDHRLGVYFANPIDGGPPATEESRRWTDGTGRLRMMPLWQRTGDTFETISLSPSVDASESGHWHGFITNGAAST